MKRFYKFLMPLVAIVVVLLVSGTAEAQNTFAHRWNIGESIGFGARNQPTPDMAMDMKLDFSRRVGETPWRWGISGNPLSGAGRLRGR